jgi:alkylation response protein AidB-like acyl-CoA dehydrogenase
MPHAESSTNYFLDNDDLRFYVEQWIDWKPVVEGAELGRLGQEGGHATVSEAVNFYREVLEMVGELSARQIGPYAAELDRGELRIEGGEVVHPPRLEAVMAEIHAMGLHGLCVPRDLGGLQAPMLVYGLTAELLARGDVSVMTHHGFHGGIAMALLMYSALEGSLSVDAANRRILDTPFAGAIRDIVENAAWGSMDITEPDAGSDMAALRCKAVQDSEGNWRLTGQKIFITSGHGRYHVVIARSEEPAAADDPTAGLAGLSLFLVEAYQEGPDGQRVRHIALERVEEKLGHHASPTLSLQFDGAPARLIGKRGEGFKLMLLLMNNARISVGFESIGLCECALRQARAYASVRRSMGKVIDRHELIAEMLQEMEEDLKGLRALAVEAAIHEERAERIRLELRYLAPTPEERSRLEREEAACRARSRSITPLLKYLAAEKAVEFARKNLQIHGGSGYTTEYGAEKLLRDSLVLPIYEGTSQIQSLMATKDALGAILKDPKGFLGRLAKAEWRSLTAGGLEGRTAALELAALQAQRLLVQKIVEAKARSLRGRGVGDWKKGFTKDWDQRRDFAPALLHAERLTRLLADHKIASCLLDQALRFPERAGILEGHLERALPRSRYLLDQIRNVGDRLLANLRSSPSA